MIGLEDIILPNVGPIHYWIGSAYFLSATKYSTNAYADLLFQASPWRKCRRSAMFSIIFRPHRAYIYVSVCVWKQPKLKTRAMHNEMPQCLLSEPFSALPILFSNALTKLASQASTPLLSWSTLPLYRSEDWSICLGLRPFSAILPLKGSYSCRIASSRMVIKGHPSSQKAE